MEIDLARHVVRAVFRSTSELEQLLPLLKAHCEPQEYSDYARSIAAAIDSINTHVLDGAVRAQPALEHEIDATIRKFDRFL